MFRIVATPWRYRYILNSAQGRGGCFFCAYAEDPEHDLENLVFFRGRHVFGLLNRYPYMWGHAMVAPYRHVGDLVELSDEELAELLRSAYRAKAVIAEAVGCGEIAVGINIGRVAGAGVADHLHVHLVPMCKEIDPSTPPEKLEEALRNLAEDLARRFPPNTF